MKRFHLIVLIIFVVGIWMHGIVYAQTETPTPTPSPSNSDNDKANKLSGEIKELQGKISDLQKQQKTISSQIGVMDSQIKLTELRMKATQGELSELGEDIEITTDKISDLEESIVTFTGVLMNRIVATYQIGSFQPLEVLVSSDSVSDFFKRASYLRIAQAHDKQLIYDTQQARNDYANQREIFEEKKEKVEALKNQLVAYTKQLDTEKKNKENFLLVTKSSEKEYQRRLSDALRELQQIQKAAQILISTESRRVSRGEAIGLMGNTGYSFGAHLHFGVYNIKSLEEYNYYSNSENPANALQSVSVDWQTGCGGDPVGNSPTGSGGFQWPMSTGNLHITQGYGHTCYSNTYYRGNPHPAYDMYNNSDIVVRAVDEGNAYFCKNCTGDGANGVFIFHPNGKMSLYWHLQ